MKTEPQKLIIPAMPLDGGASGIATYTTQLVKHITRDKSLETIVVGLEMERELLDIGPFGTFYGINQKYAPPIKSILWHTYQLPLLANRMNADIIFLPAATRRMVMRQACNAKIVGTIHDLANFWLPEKYDLFRNFYLKNVLPVTWKRADQLISVSALTKSDLLKFTSIEPSRISVVHNGFDADAFTEKPNSVVMKKLASYEAFSVSFPSKYILYVARLEHPSKGHTLLLRAFKKLLEEYPSIPHKLVFAGKDWAQAGEIHDLIQALDLSNHVITTGFVETEMLPYLYNGAELVVIPSLYEGFGIPVLEAMASGTPLIASNRGSLPEVVSSAAQIFNPENIDEFENALKIGLFDDEYRQQSKNLGKKRVKAFSWKQCAAHTTKILKS